MKTIHILAAVLALFFVSAAQAEKAPAPAAKPAGQEIVDHGWQKRCGKVKEKGKAERQYCEIFQKLQTKKESARVAEFGVGFPEGKDKARGVVVLPLGVLLEPGVAMKIDDGKPASFRIRHCLKDGCYSIINMNQELLSSMKKGKTVSFFFKAAGGQGVNLIMKLNGFETALKQVQ